MAALVQLLLVCLVGAACAQYADERSPRYIASESKPTSTPVPILKQINRHNEDGSYTYGYEAADGSFKIETKAQNGEVKGKYGYKDDTGKLRVIEYGANKYGFQPSGEGITVAPPTLVDETRDEGQRPSKAQGRSQYRAPAPQQSIDYDYEEPAPAPAPRPAPRPQPAFPAPAPAPKPYRAPQQPQQPYRAPQPAPQPQYRQQSAPTPPKPQFFAGAAPAPVANAAPAPSPFDNDFFKPAQPAPRQQDFRQQDYRPAPAPRQQDFRPAPQFAPKPQIEYTPEYEPAQPRFPPSNQFQQRSQPFSMLDQLLKEYALPAGGAAPLHDITFGSY